MSAHDYALVACRNGIATSNRFQIYFPLMFIGTISFSFLFFFFFLLFNNPDKFRTVTLTRPRLRSLNFYESSISFQKVSSNKIVQLYEPFTRFEIEIIFPRMSLKRTREKIFNSIEREKWTKLRMNQKKRSSGLEEKKKKRKKINPNEITKDNRDEY